MAKFGYYFRVETHHHERHPGMADFLIGRQQILNKNLETYGYEILFRGSDFDLDEAQGATSATNQVITDTLLEFGLNNIVGQGKAFINFTSQNIIAKTPLHLPRERIVVEILENVVIDGQIIDHVREFSQQGYSIALDDFVYSDDWIPLLEIADIVKLDVLEMDLDDCLQLIQRLKPYRLKILAEKVETHQQFKALKKAGCDYFQGFFFSRPNIVKGRRIGVNQVAALKLICAINTPDVHFDELGEIVSRDVGLSYKLLHYINSAFFSVPNKVKSIRHAITCLGMNEVKRWVNILTLATLSGKPHAILQNSLVRGKMCELLAMEIGAEKERYFLIGMFSNLDALLDVPIDEALTQLPLPRDVTEAIIDHKGTAGEALDCAIHYENWELSKLRCTGLPQKTIGAIYLQSIHWANQVLGSI